MERPEGKRSLGRPRRRREDNIKMDVNEMGCDAGNYIYLAEDRETWRDYARLTVNLGVSLKAN